MHFGLVCFDLVLLYFQYMCTACTECFCCCPLLSTFLTSPSLISESVAYEFRGKGGVITYSYPEDKKPDTKVSGEKNWG